MSVIPGRWRREDREFKVILGFRWVSEDNRTESVLSFHHVGQGIKLRLLGLLASPFTSRTTSPDTKTSFEL